jgi:hypothetical protein
MDQFNQPPQPPNELESLKAFRAEIAALKELEEKSKKTVHFENCNPAELGEEDEKIYKKLMSDDLTSEEVKEYQNKLIKSGNTSQKKFSAYVAVMLTIKLFKKDRP